MSIQALNEAGGKPSLIRWIALIGFGVGVAMVIAGLVGWFMELSNATTVIGMGTGVAFGGTLAKVVQKFGEK